MKTEDTREKIPLISQVESADDNDEVDEKEDVLQNEKTEEEDGQSLEDWQALMHLFKSFVGVGVLGLPSAVMHGGVLVGPLALLAIGIICMHNITLLVQTSRAVRERLNTNSVSYGELVQELFSMHSDSVGRISKVATDVLTCMLQLGFCCVYFMFLSVTIQKLAGALDSRLWMVIVLPLVLATAMVRDVSKLSYLTSIGNAILILGFVIIYQYLGRHLKNPVRLPFSNSAQNILIAFGQMVYAFEGIAVILPIEKRMKDKESFPWVMRVTAALIIVLYTTFGIIGYFTFGSKTAATITLNLPKLAVYDALQGMFAIVIYVTYPVQFFVAVDIFKPLLEERFDNKHILTAEYVLRVMLVLITFFLAITIPQLDNFMALIGSFCGALVALVLPPILHSLCFYNEGLTRWHLYINICITLFGIFGTISGTCTAFVAIIENFKTNTKIISSG